jgi:hypothetical protein
MPRHATVGQRKCDVGNGPQLLRERGERKVDPVCVWSVRAAMRSCGCVSNWCVRYDVVVGGVWCLRVLVAVGGGSVIVKLVRRFDFWVFM